MCYALRCISETSPGRAAGSCMTKSQTDTPHRGQHRLLHEHHNSYFTYLQHFFHNSTKFSTTRPLCLLFCITNPQTPLRVPAAEPRRKVTIGVKKNPQTPLRVPTAEPESLRPFSRSRFIQAVLPPAICKKILQIPAAVLKYKSFLTAARNLRKILQIPAAVPSFFSTETHGRSMDPERILSFVIRKYEFLRLYNRAFPKTIQGKTCGRTIFF